MIGWHTCVHIVDTTKDLHRSKEHSPGIGPNVHGHRPSSTPHQKTIIDTNIDTWGRTVWAHPGETQVTGQIGTQ